MTKTFLSILIALVLLFGAAGVTVAAAQKSQPGEPLYTLRTWSAQMLLQPNKMQISGRVEQTIQTQSRIHEPETAQPKISEQTIQTLLSLHELEITQTPQDPAPLDVCDQPGTTGQCGSHHQTGANHANDHPHQDHRNDGTNHENDGTEHEHDGH